MENPIKMDDLGVLFSETPIYLHGISTTVSYSFTVQQGFGTQLSEFTGGIGASSSTRIALAIIPGSYVITVPEKNSSSLKTGLLKRHAVFQPLIFREGRFHKKEMVNLKFWTLFLSWHNFLPHMLSCKILPFVSRKAAWVLQVFSLVGMLVYNKWMQHWRYPFILMATWSWWLWGKELWSLGREEKKVE